MPVVHIHLLKGRDKAKKRKIAEAVSQALSDTADTPLENVKIIFSDMDHDDYAIGGQLMSDIKNNQNNEDK